MTERVPESVKVWDIRRANYHSNIPGVQLPEVTECTTSVGVLTKKAKQSSLDKESVEQPSSLDQDD